MDKKIIIDVHNDKYSISLLENDDLVEFNLYKKNLDSILQNIYIGRVKSILPGMQAAFVDIGLEKNAYLFLNKGTTSVKNGQDIVVQIVKESIGTKGPVATTNVSIPGKYMVITPYDGRVNASRKIIDTDERLRLINLVKNNKKNDAGFIIRTDAAGKPDNELLKEIDLLTEQWLDIMNFSKYKTCYSLIYKELSPLLKVIRDLFTEEVSKLVVNDHETFDYIKNYVNKYYPSLTFKIENYNDNDWSLCNLYKINKKLKKALTPKIWLKNGASIVIEQTEALVSIDVNSSKFTGKKNFEETIFKVNSVAAKEIAKQIRLRNLSGIIIIDFIDMKTKEYKEKLITILKSEFKKDRYKTVVLGITNLGLVEVTRKRTHKTLLDQLSVKCEKCNGVGRIIKYH